jgi:uncharacterized membrane protein YeaQ/YmgE (transglycosylase-associated protein family)
MRRTYALAFASGLLLSLVIHAIRPELEQGIEGLAAGSQDNPPLWVVSLGILSRTILTLLPGFVAGLIASSKGILLGFAVGFLGAAIAPIVLGPLGEATLADQFSGLVKYWGFTLVWALSTGLFCAAAGAAGQLVRSNKSFERTREG